MFTPYFLTEQDLGLYPEVDVRTDACGIVVKLVFNSQVVEVLFREVIAFYCVEESNYELSPIPGMPDDGDFIPHEKNSKKSAIWKSSINYRRSYYGHLDSYRSDAVLETYYICGADYIVVVESIGSVEVQVET